MFKSFRYCSQNDLSTLNASASNRSGRLKDILQVKNDQCVYDFPELWDKDEFKVKTDSLQVEEDDNIVDDSLCEHDNIVDSIDKISKSAMSKQKMSKRGLKPKNKLAKNILHKYNMLNYRRHLERTKSNDGGEKEDDNNAKVRRDAESIRLVIPFFNLRKFSRKYCCV